MTMGIRLLTACLLAWVTVLPTRAEDAMFRGNLAHTGVYAGTAIATATGRAATKPSEPRAPSGAPISR